MKRFFLLIFIAILTFIAVLFIQRPGLLEDIWLWAIGLAAPVFGLIDNLIKRLKRIFSGNEAPSTNQTETSQQTETTKFLPNNIPRDNLVNIIILRLSDDGYTTVGLMFIESSFFCYTLEDTFQEIKVPGNTRIPSGNYKLAFRKEDSPLTQKYRDRYPDWFTYHLELKNIEDFSNVYIHNGGDHQDTEGCILVSDSINVQDEATFLTNSRETFRDFYLLISGYLKKGKHIMVDIKNESWTENLKTS